MTAPLFDVREVLWGQAGERSAQDVLGALKGWVGDGTVVFAHLERPAGIPVLQGAALLRLEGGEVRGRHMLGRFAGLAHTGLTFSAVQHAPADVPTLPPVLAAGATATPGGRAGAARWVVPRAAPRLVAPIVWPAHGADLPALHQRLEALGWSGVLGVGTDAAELWREGRLVAARSGTAAGPDALRGLRRAAAEEGAAIELAPLEGRLAAALQGLAEAQRDEGLPAAGLVCERDRTLFVARGEPELAVAGGIGLAGTYTSADRLATPPLRLPDEPAGWESFRFVLTLRGRDALNSMTDRWTAFDRQYGAQGRTMLQAVARGDALDVVARAAAVDFDALRAAVERWEAEGVIRRA